MFRAQKIQNAQQGRQRQRGFLRPPTPRFRPRLSQRTSLQVRFDQKLGVLLSAHRQNRQIYKGMVDQSPGGPHEKYTEPFFREVWESSNIRGVEMAYLALVEENQRLVACNPGMIFTRFYLDSYAGARTQRLLDWVRPLLNRFSKSLVLGQLMDHNVLLTRERTVPVEAMEQLLAGFERGIRRREGFSALGIKEVDETESDIHDLLVHRRFVATPGYYHSEIDLTPFATFSDYLRSLFLAEGHPWQSGNTRKFLEGNFLPDEAESFLRSKQFDKFAKTDAKDMMEQNRQKALEFSRRRQAEVLLEDNPEIIGSQEVIQGILKAAGVRENQLPPKEDAGRRGKALDRVVGVLRERGLLPDIRYEVIENPFDHLIDQVYPLFSDQFQRHEIRFPQPGADWFRNLGSFHGDSRAFVIWRGDQPIGFVSAFTHEGVFNGAFCGFDPNFEKPFNLYFTANLWLVLEAMRRKAKRVRLGPTLSQAKARFGAKPVPTNIYFRFYPPKPFHWFPINSPVNSTRRIIRSLFPQERDQLPDV